MRALQIGENEQGQRLDKLLHKYLKEANSSFLYRMLRKKNIVLNEKKATGKEILAAGDEVKIYFSEETFLKMRGEPAPSLDSSEAFSSVPRKKCGASGEEERLLYKKSGFDSDWIIYEDHHLLIVNKPAGILSQKEDRTGVSMNELCLSYLAENGAWDQKQGETFTPSIANRLDRNTSGLLLFGKTLPALQSLARLLKSRELKKEYLTLVSGELQDGEFTGQLQKNIRTNRVRVRSVEAGKLIRRESLEGVRRGKNAEDRASSAAIVTAWRTLSVGERKGGKASLLLVGLLTGKTHQIRAHLSAMKHPILGDPKYGSRKQNEELKKIGIKRQMLHAYRLTFPELSENEILAPLSGATFLAPLPKDMEQCMAWFFPNPGEGAPKAGAYPVQL